ncbi:hypothetical protein ACFL1X_03145 [Candidatus Hydrogenedentota bacterium]
MIAKEFRDSSTFLEAALHVRNEAYEDALALYSALDGREAKYGEGGCLYKLNRANEAVDALKKCLAIDPHYVPARKLLDAITCSPDLPVEDAGDFDELYATRLPIAVDNSASKCSLYLILVPLIPFFLAASCELFEALLPPPGDAGNLVVSLVVLSVAFVLVLALLYRKVSVIDRDTVSVKKSIGAYLLNSIAEPLDNYSGLIYETKNVFGPGEKHGNSTNIRHRITLSNPDQRKSVVLRQTTVHGGSDKERPDMRMAMEHFARVLNMPCLTQTAGGIVQRYAEDVDRSVGELARAGKTPVEFDENAPTPRHVKVRPEGDEWVVEIDVRPVSTVGLFSMIVFSVVILGTFIAFRDHKEILMSLAVILFVPSIGLLMGWCIVLRSLVRQEQLRITQQSLRIGSTKLWRGTTVKQIFTLDEIESIEVRKRRLRLWLQINSDTQVAILSRNLPPKALDWLRNFLVGVIALKG